MINVHTSHPFSGLLIVEFEVEMVLEVGHKVGDHIIPFGGEERIEKE